MAWDPAENATILFGGETHTIVNETWAFLDGKWVNWTSTVGPAPPPAWGSSLAYDPADGYLVKFGGSNGGTNCSAPFPHCNATWVFQAGHWRELPTQHTPPIGDPSPMTYDATAKDVLLFDTVVNVSGVWAAETWTFRGGNWTLRDSGIGPSQPDDGRELGGAAMAYDPTAGEDLLYLPLANDSTWAFSGGNWSLVSATGAPPSIGAGAMAFDAASNYLVFYGGASTLPYLNANCSTSTWTFRGGNWTLANSTGPGCIGLGEMAYDPTVGGVVAVIGFNGTGTWLWSSAPAPFVSVTALASSGQSDVGLSVAFSAETTGGTPPFTYAWAFGDGSTSTNESPNHAYSSPGTWPVRVTVTDHKGVMQVGDASVQVNPAANATFRPDLDPTDAGFATSFSGAATGGTGPYNFSWTFGDGNSSLTADPIHVFASPGSYTIRGWANDSFGESATGQFTEVVRPVVTVLNLTATPNPVDLDRPVNFSAGVTGGVGPYTYRWIFGDGGLGGNLSNITHLFTTNGPFVSTVQVVDSLGEIASASLNLTIRLNATIFANVSGGLAPLRVSFTGEATGGTPGYTYSWSFGNGLSSGAETVAQLFQSPGPYLVDLQVRDASGQVANASTVISVEAAPSKGTISPFSGSGLLPWTIAAVALALAGGVVVGAIARGRGSGPRRWEPMDPGYRTYYDSARAPPGSGLSRSGPSDKTRTGESPGDPSDHLSDLR
jgi:PKD repeat protein